MSQSIRYQNSSILFQYKCVLNDNNLLHKLDKRFIQRKTVKFQFFSKKTFE